MKKKWPFFLTTLPFSYSLFLLCAALDSCCIIYLTKERFLLFLKKGIMCWENPFDRPYSIRLKRIKKRKKEHVQFENTLLHGGKTTCVIFRTSSEIQDGRVWQTNQRPPTLLFCIFFFFSLHPLVFFCWASDWLLWSKITQNFLFTCNNSQKIFSLEINKKKNFDQPL
jgi:hypothetical protein